MRKKATSLLLLLPITATAFAQEQTNDSIDTNVLDEIVIEAPKVIRKSDMDVYYPSKSAVDNSKNGMQLLNNLMIPALFVNDALGSVTAAGQSVQVRINGRQATIDQVRALLPETIKRVEWMENPGLIYNGANYVLNFIVANPTLGGSLMLRAVRSLNANFGNFDGNVKLNNGRSQWEVGLHYNPSYNIKIHRDYYELFNYPDGRSITRTEKPLGGHFDDTSGRANVSYNYVKPDTTILVVDFNLLRAFPGVVEYNGLLSVSNLPEQVRLKDAVGAEGYTPSLSMYLQQNFTKNQTLVVDFKASYYSGRSWSDYVETPFEELTPGEKLTDIYTNIKDRNQVYSIEADYIKRWQNGRFSAGATYTANRNRSQYENLDDEIFHQRQDKVYFFAEYFRRFGKWTATAGMGLQYTNFLFRETNQGNHSWSPRPQASVTYSLNQNHNFRLSFTSWQSAPSLAETNIVPQQIDSFQWRVGNQNLKTSSSYMLTFMYGFNLPYVTGSFGIRAYTSPDAITPLLYWDDNKLITTYENSTGGLQNLSFFLAPRVEIIKDWLMLSAYVQYRMEHMRGTGYDLRHNAWSGEGRIALQHWGFVLSAQYRYAQRDLWGEKISWGEDFNIIELSYNWKQWQFGVGCIMPFGKYDHGSKSLSKWYKNEQHTRMDMRMGYLQISYNLQWGRQKRGVQKLINTDANVDKSTTGGR
ncbi:MAG: outer membrane beta-barrel protein [Muribaculaceae bacterium]|nr:outer membrane beta-barrel protein [Muribaculaceae bacterium]